MKQPKLAIVIPYYKLTYFEDTLKSLANQTNKNFSVYIGNDNSPENPEYLIEKYTDLITTYTNFDKNIGGKSLTKQWERCIDTMVKEEEWIMLLCDDDLLTENVVEDFYNATIKAEHVIKYATRVINEDATKVLNTFINQPTENSIQYTVDKIKRLKRSTLSEHIFKKSKYLQYRFKDFELAFGSDDVAWVDFTEGKNFYCINSSFVDYRKSVLSISNNPDSSLRNRKMKGIISSYTYILHQYNQLMNKDQKEVFVKCIYYYNRALNRTNVNLQLKYIFTMLKFVGIRKGIEIIKNNKYYFQ